MGSEGITRQKRVERYDTKEALIPLNQPKLLMNLCGVLMSTDSRHIIQALRKGPAKGSQLQPTKGWAVKKMCSIAPFCNSPHRSLTAT